MRWFRLYDEMLDDPKVQMLSPELFKTWVNLLAVASRNGGVLPAVAALAFSLRVSACDMQTRLDELILVGLMDIRADGRVEPHNWSSRQWQSDDSADRVRRHRAKKRDGNGDVTVTVTPPEADSETETDNSPLPPLERPPEKREVKSEINFGLKAGRGREGVKPELRRRAEGFGLPVAELLARTSAEAKRSPTGFFRTLCVAELMRRMPRAGPELIEAALNGDEHAARLVYPLLMEAA